MADGGARPGRRVPRFADVRHHREVDSTNRVVTDLAKVGAPDGVVVVADHQTAGRGRRRRSWVAPPGSSLLVSVLLRPDAAGGPPALTTVAGSLAAADAVAEVAGFGPALRWPNDLYADGRKLGGVLAEVVDGGAVVLGVGLNLRWPSGVPEPIAGIAVAAEEVAGRAVDRDRLLTAFLGHLEARDGALASAPGRSRTLADYRDRCETLGREVRVTVPGGRTAAGVAAGVDGAGRLVLDSDGVASVLAVGDVEHVATS
ncbi:MAG TPA: biotin--[acetyl-CoA-carboxylase] ligase [Acidimicrobiales bacterium]|nr:biotin--[acetyl-CoA-carboxylase] ligase [Acidimicrobiales bacterium]